MKRRKLIALIVLVLALQTIVVVLLGLWLSDSSLPVGEEPSVSRVRAAAPSGRGRGADKATAERADGDEDEDEDEDEEEEEDASGSGGTGLATQARARPAASALVDTASEDDVLDVREARERATAHVGMPSEASVFGSGSTDDADAAADAVEDAVEGAELPPRRDAPSSTHAGAHEPAAGAPAESGCVGWMCGRAAAVGAGGPAAEAFDRLDPRNFVPSSTPGIVRESRETTELDVLTATLPNCTKKFKVGDRKDHKRSIASAFRELGLCETRFSDYDVRWGQQWDWGWEPDKREILSRKAGDIVNNIPGFQDTVGEKLGLARMHMDCIERHGPHQAQTWCTYTKRAFNVGRFGSEVHFRFNEFRKHSKLIASQQNVKWPLFWIIKKQQKSYGSHFMQIVALRHKDLTSTGDLARWIDETIPEGGWTVQEYIKYPLTYRGRKFDVRVWGLVTSVNPLRVYLLDSAFPKISTFAYNDSTANLANPCMHVIMPLGEACIAYADRLIKPYPPSTRSRLFLDHIRGYRAKIAVDWREMWAEEVWPQIAIKILMALLQARSQPLKIDRKIKAAGRRYKRFLFLSPDFVIDANGGAFMVELNTNGFMIGDQYPELFTAQNETKAAMVMLGVTDYPRRGTYEAQMRDAIADFCSDVAPCDAEDNAALEEFVHEERHLSNGWTRIFPSELFSRYWESLDHSNDLRGDNVFMTAQDKLVESFIKTTWQPRFGGDRYAPPPGT